MIPLAAAFLVLCSFAPDLMEGQFLVVAGLCAALGLCAARGCVRWPLLALAAYLVARALWAATYEPVPPVLRVLVLRQTAVFALMGAGAWALREQVPHICAWSVPVAALTSICGYPVIPHNPSLNAALLVAALPFTAGWLGPLLVTLLTFQFQLGTSARVMLVGYYALKISERWSLDRGRQYVGLALLAAIPLGAMWYFQPYLFEESERLAFYRDTWGYFRSRVPELWGTGLGTFILFGPQIQKISGIHLNERWSQLHSDWGQLLFELGWVGLALGLWLYLDSLYRSDRAGRQSLLLLGICALFYFPVETPLIGLFCVWLIVRAQRRSK